MDARLRASVAVGDPLGSPVVPFSHFVGSGCPLKNVSNPKQSTLIIRFLGYEVPNTVDTDTACKWAKGVGSVKRGGGTSRLRFWCLGCLSGRGLPSARYGQTLSSPLGWPKGGRSAVVAIAEEAPPR